MDDETFRKGDKVRGLGRNGRVWNPQPVGTVTRGVRGTGGFVRVQWDNCCVEDDMRPTELERVEVSNDVWPFLLG